MSKILSVPDRWSIHLVLLVVVLSSLGLADSAVGKKDRKGSKESADAAPTIDSTQFQGLQWRHIGPFRGGRVTAVAGVPGDPLRFYFGATGGGVWTTDDAGTTWRNLSDGQFQTGSVGAIAVAPSDPNVLYVGMGEAQIRGVTTSFGDGVYRSTDGGTTWTHMGLPDTRQISAVRVHPTDPDLVYVAAQGNPWTDSEERGIYRSSDGGHTWIRILEVDGRTGASDLAMDATNPRVLYAAFWRHRRLPWQVQSGAMDGDPQTSGIYRTRNGGDTWEQLTNGLPEAMGKIGVAVSPADPRRVWAMVEADDGGLYRSDDGGDSFTLVNRERVLRARSWYYTKVFADPQDAYTVYVLNAPMLRSIDGGRTFEPVSTPHGDNHALWIDPDDPRRMINGNDGGANVSFNGGRTWSTQANQPTAQFYRVIVDNQEPYRVYGGQQDNSTVAIRSRGRGSNIQRTDWYAVGGCESAHVAFDPNAPRYVYAGCYEGIITEYDVETDRERNIMAYPYLGLGSDAKDLLYRFNWNAPIVVSPHDPSVLYHAGNAVLRSQDRGVTWTAISPDLTRNEVEKQGNGGAPITNEAAGAETYNTIMYLVESPHVAGELWVGTDDGLVHVTRDGGAHWSDVTPKGLGEVQVNTVEISPHDPQKVYLAATAYKFGDFSPMIWRTDDGGMTWERRDTGLGTDAFVRVVREDPDRAGLLYAGTELGMSVSFDDGLHWQSFQQNLPVVPITDARVHRGDLVIATQGRGFWILDHLAPLHQTDDPALVFIDDGEGDVPDSAAATPLNILPLRPVVRLAGGGGQSEAPNTGTNPPDGAVLDYHLPEDLASLLAGEPVDDEQDTGAAEDAAAEDAGGTGTESEPPVLVLEILERADADSTGQVIRRYTHEKPDEDPIDPPPSPSRFGFSKPEVLPAKAGHNRFVWDLEGEEVTRVDDLFVFGPKRYRVVPGTYTARLSVGDHSAEQLIEVLADPRFDIAPEAFTEQQDLVRAIWRRVDGIHAAVVRTREVRRQVEELMDRTVSHSAATEIHAAGEALVEHLEAWEEPLVQARQETFQDVINFPNRLNAQYLYLLDAIDGSDPPVTVGARQRFDDLEAQWAEHEAALARLMALELSAFNTLFETHRVPAVIVPSDVATSPESTVAQE